MSEREGTSTVFGTAADVYETGRPTYPGAAVRWLVEPVAGDGRRPRVADVGAGTGKLARGVAAAGCAVVAVDPDTAMLTTLSQVLSGVPTVAGTAEALPLRGGSVDAVVVGQAWHWVDPVVGSREVGRVLRPGGVLGLVWNLRDESEPWVRRLNAFLPAGRAVDMLAAGPPPVAAPFGAPETHVWRWTRPVTRGDLIDMVHSRSHFITASASERAAIDGGLNSLADELGLGRDNTVELPYETRTYRFIRP